MPDNKLAYEYPSEFGQIWDQVQNKRATRKNIALAVFRILKKEWYCEGINEQIREWRTWSFFWFLLNLISVFCFTYWRITGGN